MQAEIKKILINNFKGIREKEISFNSQNIKISGCNASGKTTIVDAVTWTLFGVDSQWNAKFEIRPLDENGEKIHNIEISVCVVFEIDGKEKSFKRELKENWVTKRGTSERTLQGNIGVYSVDGYPKSEKEYKECVAGIISEDLFKILTSPTYFPNIKWQEQREILMRLITDISDVELARQDKRFSELISELEKAPSTDDIKNKYQKALTEWKKKQAEIPVRIDELEKRKSDIDVAKLEFLKKSLNEQIAENKAKQEDISKEFEEQQKARDGILELKFELNDLQRKANEELIRKKRESNEFIIKFEEKISDCERGIRETDGTIKKAEWNISDLEKEIEEWREKYTDENEREFDENRLICPYCKQEYQEEKKDELRADFARHKSEELKRITKRGNECKKAIDGNKDWIKKLKEQREKYVSDKEKLQEQFEPIKRVADSFPESIDISDRPEIQEIQRQIAEKEAAMNKGNSAEEIRQRLKEEGEDLQSQKTEIEKQLVLVQKNVGIDDRIAELQSEQREIAQKVADQEKMLYLLEEFIRFKMDRVSDAINQKLDGIYVKLFENQINSGVKECCELTYDGVPYGSLNNGHRIVTGLKIIKALQEFYGIYAPVFIDNAESLSYFNIPKINCQMIFLSVPVLTSWQRARMTEKEINEFYDYYKELKIETEG